MQHFGEAIERGDLDAVVALLDEDVVFRSPVVHAPYQGREVVGMLLQAVAGVMEDFRYVRRIGAEDAADHALVFRAMIGDRELEGCDFIHVGNNGLIDEFYVMVRPLSSQLALAEAMKQRLALAQSAGP